MQVTRTEAQIMKELQKIDNHDRCCFIYETEEEWEVSIIPFIKQGLLNGEKCVYHVQRRDEEYILNCIAKHGIEIDKYLSTGQFHLLRPSYTLPTLKTGNMDEIIQTFRMELQQYLDEGFSNIRIISESISRLMDEDETKGCFLELQLRLSREIFPGFPVKGIAQFHRHKDSPVILKDAIISHSCIFKDGYIYRNPATITPDMYFRHKETAWEAEYWLRIQEALLNSEKKYRLIFEHSKDLITVIDAATFEIIFISPVHSSLLGYTPEEVIGHNCLEFIHPDQRDSIVEEFRRESAGFSSNGIYAIRKQDGSYLWTEGKGDVIRNINGHDQLILFRAC